MDFAATQVYEDEDFPSTQRISYIPEEKGPIQIGTLRIQSTEYQIKEGFTKIGRHSSSDIVIKDATVSNIHAEIEASAGEGSTWICDLDSSNKTKLNNLILRPNRSYELKNGSIIEFGKVRATYQTYRPANDTIIPETPAPMQRVVRTIIPNTPDSSINNSSCVDNDGSIIPGTQKDDENNIFQRPLDPQQNQSTNVGKKNTSDSSLSVNDDSQIAALLHVSNVDVSQNRKVSIFDMDTQKFEEKYGTSTSIHDIETQKFATKELFKTNATSKKQLSKNDVRGELAEGNNVANIHNVETQNYIDDDKMNEEYTRSSRIDSQDVTAKKLTMDIHDIETQNYVSTAEDKTRQSETNRSKIQMKNMDRVECNTHNLETELDKTHSAEGIHDIETQLESNDSINKTNNKLKNTINEGKNKDNILATKNGTRYEKNTKLSSSRSSSPASLNLSSPGIDEECPSSLLNESVHLLESSSLLEYFSEGIDKHEKIQASTPKSKTYSTEKHIDDIRNMSNASDNEDDNDEDNIFDVPTQHVNRKFENLSPGDSQNDKKNATRTHNNSKKKCGMSRLPSDDSETDAEDYIEELVKKQRESLETSNKPYNENSENRNEPGTSIDSEDMFDMPTQRLKNHTSKNTSNSSFNQLRETNKIDIDNMAPTQPINNRNTCDQVNQSNALSADVNDVAPSTQPAQPRGTSLKTVITSKDSSPKNNRNNVDDVAVTKIININADVPEAIDASDCRIALENLDCEDINYEMAPTQIIDEVNDKEKGNSVKKNLDHDKTVEPSEVNLNDTLERNLNEMFSDINNDSIQEPQQMSTQNLEDILESQYNNDLDDVNKSTVDDTNNISRTQSGRKSRSRSSRNLSRNETNKDDVNNAETDSQNSDVYFSTKRKRNIITDTQELTYTVEKSSGQDNSSRKSKEKSENELTKSNRKGKKAIKSKHRSIVITDDLNKNNVDKTISSENNEGDVKKSKLMKQKGEITLETNEQVLVRDSREVDDTEKDLASNSNIYASCSSKHEQTSNISYENDDDDILIRLPAVRISGTHSNPPSPSVSSTSIANVESKKNVTKRKSKRVKSARAKLLCERIVENSEKDNKPSEINDESSVPLSIKNLSSSVAPILRIKNTSKITTSSDSDSETSYKRFKQMADKVLNNESNYTKKRNKDNVQSTNKSAIFNKKKNVLSSSDISKSSEGNSDAQTPKSPVRSSSRSMRYHNRQSKDNSCVLQMMKDMHAENKTDTSTKVETVSIAPNGKRSLHAIEEDAEQKSKKRKADRVIEELPILTRSRRSAATTNRQFANNFEYSVETNSRASSPVIGNTRSSEDRKSASEIMLEKTQETSLNPRTDGDVDAGKSNVKRIRRKINDNQAVTCIDDVTTNKNSNKAKQEQAKKEETGMSLTGDKIIKIVLDPLIIGNESQEVMMIMKEASNNARDDNLPIKEKNNARILQRKSRNIRGKKKPNTDNDIDSVSAASSTSFDISDSNNMLFDNAAPKVKRGRSLKSVPPLQAQTPEKKEAFKRSSRIGSSVHSILNASAESTTSKDSRDSTKSNILPSPRLSRSQATNIKRMEEIEVNQNTRRNRTILSNSLGIITNVEDTSMTLMSSKTRKNVSILNNSSPSTSRHKILFTGIMEDKYNKIVKTLGGNKVEDPAKCTVLVTDKVRRTYKFLCTLARGIPIVAIEWLRDSESAAQFLDWESYILKDPVAEAKFGFRLRKSLDKAKEKKLLDGYTVVLTPGVAPPPVNEIKDMVTSCGGKALLRPPTKWPEKAIIISREEDLSNAKKFLAKAPKSVTVQSTEFILTGILRQETDFDKYKLT